MGEDTIIKRAKQSSNAPTYNFASIEAQAKEMVDIASIEAARLLEKAHSEIQRLREEQRAQVADEAYDLGYKEGYNKGLADGEREGLEAGEQKALQDFKEHTKATVTSINAIATEFEAVRESILDEAKHDLLDASLDLAVKATFALVNKDESLQNRASEMVKLLADKTSLKIFVCPAGLTQMETLLPEIASTLRHNEAVELIEDESLQPGAIRLVSGKSNVDSDPVAIVNSIIEEIKNAQEKSE